MNITEKQQRVATYVHQNIVAFSKMKSELPMVISFMLAFEEAWLAFRDMEENEQAVLTLSAQIEAARQFRELFTNLGPLFAEIPDVTSATPAGTG